MAWIRVVLLVLLVFVVAGAQPGLGRTQEPSCSWGASSITGKLVNGRFVVTTGPTTSGCIPRESPR